MMKHGRLKLLLDPTEIRNLLMTEEAISLISSQKYARNSILPADGDPQITKWAPLDAKKKWRELCQKQQARTQSSCKTSWQTSSQAHFLDVTQVTHFFFSMI
jgi:hypothetical protein